MLFRSEIPYDIKNEIINICMLSKGKNVYNYIPKFNKEIDAGVCMPGFGSVCPSSLCSCEENQEDLSASLNPSLWSPLLPVFW